MDAAEIERILGACEREPAADVRRLGFWRAVGAVKRSPEFTARYADRIARIDRAAFERAVPLRVPIGVGIAMHLASIGLGLVLCALALAPAGSSPVATSPVREIVFLVASQALIGVVHTFAHWLVGTLVGIRFTHVYTALPKPQPGIKIDYASYLRAPARGRAWMHASGAIASKLLPFIAYAFGAQAGLEQWALWVLLAIGAISIVIDLTLSTRASDWKRFRREMRAA
jgi:hypothetical protein